MGVMTSSTDAAADGGRCDPTAPFGLVTRLPGDVNQPNSNEVGGRLSPDETSLYLSIDQGEGAGFRLHSATQDDAGAFHLASGTLLDGPDGGSDYSPALLADNVTLYFARVVDDSAGRDHVFRATRASPAAPFGPATEVTDLVGNGTEGDPFFSDDVTVYFVDGYNGGVLYTASRVGTAFTPPTMIPLPMGGSPVVTSDNLTLYYSRTVGSVDLIYRSTRQSPSADWGTPVAVTEINDSQSSQHPTWISADGCLIVFERVYQNSYDLFWARK
jgi:hypothetical protein